MDHWSRVWLIWALGSNSLSTAARSGQSHEAKVAAACHWAMLAKGVVPLSRCSSVVCGRSPPDSGEDHGCHPWSQGGWPPGLKRCSQRPRPATVENFLHFLGLNSEKRTEGGGREVKNMQLGVFQSYRMPTVGT